jgi:hypothetical protein
MNFIIELPESNECMNVIMIMNYLSKDIYFVPLIDLEADTMVKVIISEVF